MTSLIALALAPTFFVMLLGYGAGRFAIIDNIRVAELNIVTMSFALPAALFVATATTPRDVLIAQWPVLVSLSLVMLGTFLSWYCYQRIVRGQTASEAALQSLAVGQPNYAAAGLPVITALFGTEHIATVAVGIGVGSLLPSPLTLIILELAQTQNILNAADTFLARLASAVWHAVSKPIVLAPIIGALSSITGLTVHPVVSASLREIGQAGGGLALFVTGLILSQRPFRLSRNTILGSIVSNVAQPLLTLGVCLTLGAPDLVTKLSVIMAALPSGFFGILFGTSYKQVSDEANSTIIASTIFSALTLAIAIAWANSYYH